MRPPLSPELELQRLCLELPGLSELLKEFQIKAPATQLYVLRAADPALGGNSILDMLAQVRDLIRTYGEMGS